MVICEQCKRIMKFADSRIDLGIAVILVDQEGKAVSVQYGDRLTCPQCESTTIARFGDSMDESHPHFSAIVEALRTNAKLVPSYIMEVTA